MLLPKNESEVFFVRTRTAQCLIGIALLTLVIAITSTILTALLYNEYEPQDSTSPSSVSKPPLLSTASAIIVIDVQNDFLANRTYPDTTSFRYTDSPLITISNGIVNVQSGSLGVPNTEDLALVINSFISRSASYLPKHVFTLDWHPVGHCSFYSNSSTSGVPYVPQSQFNDQQNEWRCHDDRSQRSYSYGDLVQWAPHCVASSAGVRFDPALIIPEGSFIVKKGFENSLDSYSGFYGRQSELNNSNVDVNDEEYSGLWNMKSTMELLNGLNVRDIVLVGVASDYCVYNSAIDAVNYVQRVGGQVYIVNDLVRPVNPGDAQVKFRELASMGVRFVNSTEFFY